jgi:hypothetical protein
VEEVSGGLCGRGVRECRLCGRGVRGTGLRGGVSVKDSKNVGDKGNNKSNQVCEPQIVQ